MMMGQGNSSTISRSKIKKITARRKNRREKGKRADPFGSNPHSNGEVFSRSCVARKAINEARTITRRVINKESKAP